MLVLGFLRRCRPRSPAAYALPRATWYELQNDLQMFATCVGLGGPWKRLSYELRPSASSAGLGAV